MKKKTHTNTHPVIEPRTTTKFSQIKLGVDVHELRQKFCYPEGGRKDTLRQK